MISIEHWGWYSMAVNVILAAINLTIATGSGSLAVGAEIVHNVVDLLAAIGVLIGLKLSTRKSKAFPYGLYKLETVVAVVMAGMIFFTALLFAVPAKEIVVSSRPIMYGRQTTLAVFSFITFYMLYLPCLLTAWVTRKESHGISGC